MFALDSTGSYREKRDWRLLSDTKINTEQKADVYRLMIKHELTGPVHRDRQPSQHSCSTPLYASVAHIKSVKDLILFL